MKNDHITIIHQSHLAGRKCVKLATERSLCCSVVLQFLGVRACGQHLRSIYMRFAIITVIIVVFIVGIVVDIIAFTILICFD